MGKTEGSCLCGAVRFEGVPDTARGIGACHCKMCRVQSSGPFLAMRMTGGVRVTRDDGLAWYDASDQGERGFCNRCGASLFWRAKGAASGDWAVSAGALPDDLPVAIFEHIWADAKPGYYEFSGDAPRRTEVECLAGAPAPIPNSGR